MIVQDPNAQRQETFLDQLWEPRTGRVLSTALIFVIVLAFLRAARETLTLFLFAILFAYFLAPLVGKLQGRLRGRGRAILIVYAALIGALVLIGFIAGPSIGDESKDLTLSLPSLLDRLASGELVQEFGRAHHLKPAVSHEIQGFLVSHRSDILGYGRTLGAKLAQPAQHIWWLVLIPILSLFFLRQGNEIAEGAVDLGRSPVERGIIRGLLDDVNVMLGSYIRAQITLAGLTLIAYSLVLGLMRVPYAFILAPVAGFLEFIPVVGPAVAAVAILMIAVLAGYSHALWLVFFLGMWRLTQDYVSAPRIMGKSLEINPLLQIFAVLAGGEIAGVVGALISVPVVATIRIVGRRMRGQDAAAPISTEVKAGS
jgi:predicted PurR-regulated permease PerM